MKKLLILLIAWQMVASCEKVSNLNNDANVTQFQVYSTKPSSLTIDQVRITTGDANHSDSIIIEADALPNYFPIQVLANLKTEGAWEVIGYQPEKPIVFNNLFERHTIYLVAESGQVHKYTIALGGNSVLEVKSATATNITPAGLQLNKISIEEDQYLVVNMKALWSQFPVSMNINISGTNISTVEGVDFSQAVVFDTPLSSHKFTVKSRNGLSKEYTIFIYRGDIVKDTQLPNNQFTLWTGSGTSINIDPTPGKGLGWSTANNTIAVQGTKPYTLPDGAVCAQIKTNKVNSFLVKTIAAGTLYTGKFEMNLGQINTPKLMTWFGIPFTEKPKSVKVHLSYSPGGQMEKYANGRFTNIPGTDRGVFWAKLLRYTGSGTMEYHGDTTEGVEEVASFYVELDNTNGWVTLDMPFKYKSENQPTHIAVVLSSSYRGDYFEGANGSYILVDDVKLIYQ